MIQEYLYLPTAKFLKSLFVRERVIGRYQGEENGPLLVVLGGIHGNEPAGVLALDLMFKMLEVEPITNPDFQYKGTLLGLVGNLKAYVVQQRFIDKDLNRIWNDDHVEKVMNSNVEELVNEDRELYDILQLIREELNTRKYSRLIVLDMHTTSSFGGIFSIPTEDEESIRIALELHAPVITGMLEGIKGTTLHYFRPDNFDLPTVAVTFESGQHNERLSINRAIAAITNCMRTVGSVKPGDVENRHDTILKEYSENLPKITKLISRHDIAKGDQFQMLPNYNNFQAVTKGEVLAKDKNGDITAVDDSLILMPLYQKKGDDGFFLVQQIEGY